MLRAPRARDLENRRSFNRLDDFERAVEQMPDRLRIVAEGDSWFDYPRKHFPNKPANIIDHIQHSTHKRANLLRLEANGDEMTQMMSDKQRHGLTRVLDIFHRRGKPIDVLLYSGGGNDIVGDYDMERFLKPFTGQRDPADALNAKSFGIKAQQIKLAWEELVDIRNQFSPTTKIFTHTYDLPYVTGIGAKFFGIEFTDGWIKPAMDKRGLPADDYNASPNVRFRRDVVSVMFETISANLKAVEAGTDNFFVTDTFGTLERMDEWLNEIHPTSDGFLKIAEKVYATMHANVPGLPDWKG